MSTPERKDWRARSRHNPLQRKIADLFAELADLDSEVADEYDARIGRSWDNPRKLGELRNELHSELQGAKYRAQSEPPTYGQEVTNALQDWLDYGGGNPAGKGRPTLESDDPRVTEPPGRVIGGWEGGVPVPKQGKTPGRPRITGGHTGEPGDFSLVNIPEVLQGQEGGSGGILRDLGQLQGFSPEQISQLLESIYGDQGSIRRKGAGQKGPTTFTTPMPMPTGPRILSTPADFPKGPMIHTTPLLNGPPTNLFGRLGGGKPPSGFYTPADLRGLLGTMARAHVKAR